MLADVVRPDPAELRPYLSACEPTLSDKPRSFEASDDGVCAEVVDADTGATREHRSWLSRRAATVQTVCVRRSLGIDLNGETLGYPVHLYFRAPGLLGQSVAASPTTFFVTVDREGVWSNVRIIDPANAMWRLMVLDAGADLTPKPSTANTICGVPSVVPSRSSGSARVFGRDAVWLPNAIRMAASSLQATPYINCRRPVRSG